MERGSPSSGDLICMAEWAIGAQRVFCASVRHAPLSLRPSLRPVDHDDNGADSLQGSAPSDRPSHASPFHVRTDTFGAAYTCMRRSARRRTGDGGGTRGGRLWPGGRRRRPCGGPFCRGVS
ncbi:hypothetical protein CC85DRAFT_157592 [Cutaneotrichosporon oleaginosum]|uniref:Uncharacterized protein n=1 Tax=Cutaneotrichosporon oleaginosum TaxID=879819 RepID=A0A0J0XH03_9TREE|nr:uncharacterized protein CC85DRAFT_157592 [Cutaneotrichosporon oleaginosum]KLT40361.1 hypothetical protein CC85DRAFT_157592 [Cutaneotrichosporon oleaginosum]TXT06476.1 hypothetical protein COLE_05807 [Cutaneotrichosporon oleaginosum]